MSSSNPPPKRPDQEQDGDLAVQERQRARHARRYQVLFHNDDYTTMEFVVHVLMEFFHLSETGATRVMLEVHHKGYGVAGVFSRDIAETKAEQVMAFAKEHGHPLRVTAEPEDDGEDDE